MKEEITGKKSKKKKWNLPQIISLDFKKTEGGTYEHQTEDFASGTINPLSP
jgi:hypothetical protein